MSLSGPNDRNPTNRDNVRPFVFDIMGPDQRTSVLPDNLRLVMYVNPQSVSFTYSKLITSIQTRGGFVQQHWGDIPTKIAFQAVTGGFKRLYSGLSNITGGGTDLGGTRRETLAYDSHLDLLALFRSNGTFTDANGIPIYDGAIKLTFDEGEYIGWFDNFEKQENSAKPFQFDQSFNFTVKEELQRFRSLPYTSPLIRGTVTGRLQSADFVPQ